MDTFKPKVVSFVLNSFVNDNRVLKTARSLSNAGYDVTVMALKRGDVPEFEFRDGFRVRRIELLADRLPQGKHFTVLRLAELLLRSVSEGTKYDIVHCNDFDPMIAVAVMKILKPSLKVVYDTHEYAREKNGVEGLHKLFVKLVEPLVLNFANQVVTVSDGIASEYRRLFDLDEVHVILNTPNHSTQKATNQLRENLQIPKGKRIFLYQGRLGIGRGIELLIDGFERLADTNAVLVFMGYGPVQALVEAASDRLPNVFFHPAVPHDEIVAHTSSADWGIISVENVCLSYYHCMPNKLFEYIHAGIPIITTNLADCKTLVEGEKIGTVIPEFTVESVCDTVRKALNEDPSKYKQALGAAAKKYRWEIEEEKLLSIYSGLDAASPEESKQT